MLVIWEKKRGKRRDIVFIQKDTLRELFEKHVMRTGIKDRVSKTCLVRPEHGWFASPNKKEVYRLLRESIFAARIDLGGRSDTYIKVRFPIPHHLFKQIKCRVFQNRNGVIGPITDPFDGDFCVDFDRVRGGSKAIIKQLDAHGHVGMMERIQIKEYMKHVELQEGLFLFVIHHIYPASRKKNPFRP